LYISLPELEAILKEARDREQRQQRFLAAIQGIDLDKHSQQDSQQRLEAAQRRVAAKLSGESEEKFELNELDLDYEIEE